MGASISSTESVLHLKIFFFLLLLQHIYIFCVWRLLKKENLKIVLICVE